MEKWLIKEISEMTQTSVRMLRHYDKIGLLKPSYRSANGYRCYTAKDVATLQQIIALKYFGFNLNTIKAILAKHDNVYAHLQVQHQVVKEQSAHFQLVNEALESILKSLSPSVTPDWNDLITLISRYQMTGNLRAELKKTWVGQRLVEEQFEEYLSFYEKFPKEFATREAFIQQINNQELGDPDGPDGERVITFMYDFGKKMKTFSGKMANFGSQLLKDIQSGKLSQLELTAEGTLWISRASLSFWLKRWDDLYTTILKNIKSNPQGKTGKLVASEWTGLIDDFFSMGSRSLLTGLMIWQDMTRQFHDMKQLTLLKPKELIKDWHIKLLFDPEAMGWISQALEAHSS